MKKPNRLVTFLYGLVGMAHAYDTADEVREVIADNCFNTLAERARTHGEGADRLSDSLAFQPGLLDLHDELHDTWHYLTALKARARDLGYGTLTENLDAAADSTRDVLQAVATAAENTVPSPAIPARK
ncbi:MULTISPECIES: hypothetical protein [Streptomyces]|uniref:Uncharacterized protein n=1 Tax=Streptomyces tsukubensis (strain DSM 42081 / NBRC 108919 / NRRL 18488 / 9993) TaxID=1114943 RepID=I2MT05_STRT9|nr:MULTISPECIES: hypothetical protein [Streptomyces]AZK98817.1 hypothetical protein B7R87_33190 [Streptomyces tsukubensis]EIF87902.1 hypothetical protein [Streptomyces tsukubensis NRRL18488]MYS66030.1 hypothetical protein [Streptomyces sp. SID5473]QKM65816.1 hypothetical protein STSU_000235 [Streptomyces tsukubensis NRRL18488]